MKPILLRDSNFVTVNAANKCTFTFTIGDEFYKSLNSDKAWMKQKFLDEVDKVATQDFIQSQEFENLQLLLAEKMKNDKNFSCKSDDAEKDAVVESLRSFFETKLNRKMTTINYPFVPISNFSFSFINLWGVLYRAKQAREGASVKVF